MIEFNDHTRASFRLRADVVFAMEPEVSGNDAAGDIANAKVLKTRPIAPPSKTNLDPKTTVTSIKSRDVGTGRWFRGQEEVEKVDLRSA